MSGRSNPFDEMERFFERLSERFDEMGRQFDESALPSRGDAPMSLPGLPGGETAVDVVDDGDAFVVVVDLPGFERDDVDLQLREDRLRFEASRERDEETVSSDGRYVRRERRRQSVGRTVRLPEPVVADGVSATLTNGVLRVTLPKAERDAGHRIEVE
jgi:HSP20 family protein